MPLRILNHSWPAITWSVIIFILLTLPAKDIPSEEVFSTPNFDKLVHFILFGGFVYLWARYFYNKLIKTAMGRVIGFAFLISSAYGIGMEYYQRYALVDRTFDYYDIIADISGALAGALICLKFFRKGPKPS